MKRKLLKSAILLTAANVLLRLLGLLRELILANVYGAGVAADAFVVAQTIPGTILAFIGGAVTSMYIPMYQQNKERGNQFTSNIINMYCIIGLLFSIAFTFFPEPLVFIFASQLDAETFQLASSMLRLMVWAAIPLLLSEIYRSFLHIHNLFFRASIATAGVNFALIASILVSDAVKMPVLMGAGVVAGNLLCMGVLFYSARKNGLRYVRYLRPLDDDIKELLRLIAPIVLVTVFSEIGVVVDRNFASSLPTGSIASLSYANRLIAVVTGLTGAVLATVMFPKMSEAAAQDTPLLTRILMGCVRKLLPVLMPLAAGTVLLAQPVVRLLFERGEFKPEDTIRTAECLQMYALCLIGGGVNALFIRALYAVKRTKAPALVSALAIGIDILLNILLIGPLQHRGLALSTGIASIVTMSMLIFMARRAFGPLGLRRESAELAKTFLATAVMAAAVWLAYEKLHVMAQNTLTCALCSAALVLSGAIVYAGLHAVLRTEFFKECLYHAKALIGRIKAGS